MKTRNIVALAILALVLAAGTWGFLRPERSIPVKGNATAQEIKGIKRAVKQAMRAEVLPSLSWLNIKKLPARASQYLGQDMQSVTVYRSNYAIVVVVASPITNSSVGVQYYNVVKGTNGWKAHSRAQNYDFDQDQVPLLQP